MTSQTIIIEQMLNAPAERVWQALTDHAQLQQWYFDFADFKAEVGFEFRFIGSTEQRQYSHVCTVTEVLPCEKLSYNWRYEGYDGMSYVTFSATTETPQAK